MPQKQSKIIFGEGAVDQRIVTRWFKKFCSVGKNLDNQTKSGWFKIVDSEAVLEAIKENLVSSTLRVSGEFGISQSSVVCNHLDLSKSMWSCQIKPHVTKILQKFWLNLVK